VDKKIAYNVKSTLVIFWCSITRWCVRYLCWFNNSNKRR